MSQSPEITPATVSQVIQELRSQLAASNNALQDTQQRLIGVQNELVQMKQQVEKHNRSSVKANKPLPYKGKGSILSWTTHVDNYLQNIDDDEALQIAVSYLQESAHEWWISYSQTDEGEQVQSWDNLCEALIERFDTINEEKIARDKLAKWRQIKDVNSFNEDFQKIILEIPNISIEEQIDRYTRGLKSYIWKELCTNDYDKLSDAMKDAERVEAAHKRSGNNPMRTKSNNNSDVSNKPVPMEIGNIQLQKLTKEERDRCMKEGLCLRCRMSGHIAKNCPKGKQN